MALIRCITQKPRAKETNLPLILDRFYPERLRNCPIVKNFTSSFFEFFDSAAISGLITWIRGLWARETWQIRPMQSLMRMVAIMYRV
jgi:hypothetical protein